MIPPPGAFAEGESARPAQALRAVRGGGATASWRMLLVVALAAFGVRAAVLWYSPSDKPVTGDSVGYDDLAWRLVQGEGYTRSWAPNTPYLRRPPGYPVWLAGVYALFGHSPRAAMWVQALLDTCTAVLITALAWRWAGIVAGALAGLLYACYPPLVVFTTYLVSETLFLWLVVALMWMLVLAWTRQQWGWWVAAGVLLGLAHLVKSVLVAFPLVLFALLWAGDRRLAPALARAVVVTVVSLAVAAPWMIRNWRVSGRPLLAQEGLGWALWAGTLDPYSAAFTTSEEPAWKQEPIASHIAGARSMEEMSQRLLPEALATIRRDPAGYAWLGVKKAWRMVTVPWGMSHLAGRARWLQPFYLVMHGALLVLAGVGGWWLIRQPARQEVFLVFGLLGYVVAFFAAFFVVPRYALPLMPFVICLGAVGMAALFQRRTLGQVA